MLRLIKKMFGYGNNEGNKMREVNTALYKIETLYLDWINNFLTVKKFAEFYGITEKKALMLIDIGKAINNTGVRNE